MKRITKVLVTGASGMLGSTLVELWKDKYEIYATSFSIGLPFVTNYKQFNLMTKDYTELIEWSRPDVIIHTAALTNVNECHEDPGKAMNINGLSLYELARATSPSCRIIYISTDAVFPSSIHRAKESDITAPESTYGASKQLGEFFLLQYAANYTIIRTTIVGINKYKNKQGFVEWIIKSASNNEQISLFDDVLFNPISCKHLADSIDSIMQTHKFKNDVVHIAGSQTISKYQFGMTLLEKLGVPSHSAQKGSILSFNKRAKRSVDQSLDSSYYLGKSKIELPGLDECVEQIAREYNEKKRHTVRY